MSVSLVQLSNILRLEQPYQTGILDCLVDPALVTHGPGFHAAPHPTLPPPGNPNGYRVPDTWETPSAEGFNRRLKSLKSDTHYWSRMKWWDREFKNEQYLSTLTLSELGALLEWSVHNDMHMRWASIPRDPQTNDPIPTGRADNDIREVWDDPVYDFLGEFYSSHVNPVFWRLHGWVDDRITDWFNAHEATHPGEVEEADVDGVRWFRKGKWVHTDKPCAGPATNHGGHHDVRKMEEVVEVLYGPPPASGDSLAITLDPTDDDSPRQTWF